MIHINFIEINARQLNFFSIQFAHRRPRHRPCRKRVAFRENIFKFYAKIKKKVPFAGETK